MLFLVHFGLHVDLVLLDVLLVLLFLYLPSFVFVIFIHVDVCNCSNHFSLLYTYPPYENSTVCLLPVDGHVACFQVYAFANYFATNFLIISPYAHIQEFLYFLSWGQFYALPLRPNQGDIW